MVSSDEQNQQMIDLFKGFSKLNREDRLQRLLKMGALQPEDMSFLKKGSTVSLDLAEKFIENVVGYFQVPMGVATNFVIDKKAYVIPMAVEETSIIAAASKTAKWILEHGEIETQMAGSAIIGQIQINKVKDFFKLEKILHEHRSNLIEMANEGPASGLVQRGGGVE